MAQELKAHRFWDYDEIRTDAIAGSLYYLKSEADKVIAKLEAENAALKEEHRWRWFSEDMPKDGEIVWLYNKSLNQIVKALHYGEGRFVLATDHGCAFDADLWMPMNTPKAPEDT